MEKEEREIVKISVATVFLGVWLFAAPATFGYLYTASCFSEWIAGILLVVFGLLSMQKERYISAGIVCLVGIWLQLSPLFFWAPEPQAYVNATAVGILALVFGLHHPGMTGLHRKGGLHNPPGWSFNPSSWSLRAPTIGLAVLCWFFARYMAAFQLGYIDFIWDPIFGDGTREVITSTISHMFPVPDAGLGAFVYTLEALMGWQGDTKRWHTMPWMVLIFGFFVVPAGLISILLIISQPVFVGAWCGWCLATAACMLVMILFTFAEVVATVQFLLYAKREGMPFWRTVWFGGVIGEVEAGKRPRVEHVKRGAPGITIPWNLVVTAFIGVFMMLDPGLTGTVGAAADLAYVVGPLMIVFSVVAFAESARAFRFVNMLLGLLMVVCPWVLEGATPLSTTLYVVLGVVAMLLSLRRGKVVEKYGRWDKFIF